MMPKILFLPSIQKNLNIELSKKETAKLPRKLFLAYSIQYKKLAESIKKQLKSRDIQVKSFKQVLGCTKLKTNLPILLVSTGRFHAQNLFACSTPIYVLEENKIIKIPDKEINELKTKKKTALLKFLKEDKIGILVSTKPGQQNLKKALELKEILKKNKKIPYVFISNNLDVSQFENFNIKSWVNTACPGLAMDNPNIINMSDLPLEYVKRER